MKRKLVWFVLGLSCVLLIDQAFFSGHFPYFVVAGIASTLLILAVFAHPIRKVLPLLIGVLFACIWMPTYEWMFPQLLHVGSEEEVRVIAVADDYSYPAKSGDGVWCLCRVETINGRSIGNRVVLDVYFRTEKLNLRPGDHVLFDAELLPFENTDDFMEFTYYKTRYIDARAFTNYFKITPCETVPTRYLLKVLSNSIKEKIDNLFGPSAGLIRALLTGDRKLLTTRQTENLRVAGLSHVVAVSGMHVAFLVGFILLVFGRRRAPFLALPVILLFGMMIGPIPSVMRALFMQCMILFAPLLKQEADAVTSLAGALGLILLVNPYSILDVGLQLSFGATLGLVLYAQKLNDTLLHRVKIKNKLLAKLVRYLVTTFAVSICAMIFTVPISMLSFGTFSLIAPLSNVLTIWSVSILFVGGIAVVVLSFLVPIIAYYAAIPVEFLGAGFLWAVDLLAKIPYGLLDAQNPILIAFIVYAFVIFLWIVHKKRRKPSVRAVLPLLLIPLIITISAYVISVSQINGVSATVLDVGHGLSVLVETKDETILVDCGSKSHNAAQAVYDKLLKRSDRTIDALVLTHLDTDHINGVESVLGRLRVSKLYLHAELTGHTKFETIQKSAAENGTELVLVRYQKEISFANTYLTLYPVEEGKERMLAVNLSAGETDILITGDMGVQGEEYLLDWFDLPDVEYYVVGHHGSKTATSDRLLDEIDPEYALISVDSENQYGHPHEEVLDKFRKRGVKLLLTNKQGNIPIKC